MLQSIFAVCQCGRHHIDVDAEVVTDSSEACRTAKAGLNTALEIAESAIDGLPIPGAKAIFGGAISIIKGINVCLCSASSTHDAFRSLKIGIVY